MVIAIDVDGTLYEDSMVAPEAIEALSWATAQGHLVLIVTGRRWLSLFDVIPDVVALCAGAVCENGGVLVQLAPVRTTLLTRPVSDVLVAGLLQAGVDSLDIGDVALGAPTEHAPLAAQVLARVGGDEVIVQNKGSIMLLPPGCDKGTGLRAALVTMGLTGSPIIAIGDAANDLPMFAIATHPVGVANADAVVRASGVPLTAGIAGLGVAEALRRLLPGPPAL